MGGIKIIVKYKNNLMTGKNPVKIVFRKIIIA
jgi:hypothetical protein